MGGRRVLRKETIICPGFLFQKVMEEKIPQRCKRTICCYQCEKRERCNQNACALDLRDGYPERCDNYGLTRNEVKRLMVYMQVFSSKDLIGSYVQFMELVKVEIKRKKYGQKT